MNELINIEAKNTLTSLEVAEITGKDHKSILRDIRDEIDKLGEERGRLILCRLNIRIILTENSLPFY
ncbi:hypothetical protein JMUB3936_1360 [Leptotrichia wadei]|uniref:Phage regulatory protein Rha n=1 Tax=Leptotrichia wadei TaxID=157687 RepID=A0A510KTX4_9FUSO|nr:Rha family transcriptional regulator [Leptotrichia wadei]BBM55076.1 hypothetical protein JMUB3936_1360 [Leptotrichia wadei]